MATANRDARDKQVAPSASQTGAEPRPVMYIAVSGDIVETFRQWLTGVQDTSQTSMTYSAQFFEFARRTHRRGIAIGNARHAQEESAEGMTVSVAPESQGGTGAVFHFRMLKRSLRNCRQILRKQAKDVIVMDGAGYWFPLALIHNRDRRIYLSVHTVLWTGTPSKLRRWILAAEAWFIRNHCAGVLAVSDRIAEQVSSICGDKRPEVRVFTPLYSADDFADVLPVEFGRPVFQILYAGRVEQGKGVFDLLEIAKALSRRGAPDFCITICGDGSDLQALEEQIDRDGLSGVVKCLGHQQRSEMIEQMSLSSCLIVPTRSTFVEGFNKVVVESILAGRPVITSKVCPALDRVRLAAIEVRPDDVEDYASALELLMRDRDVFEQKVAACRTLTHQFVDPANSWMARVGEMIR